MKNNRALLGPKTRHQLKIAYAGMCHLIDVLFRVNKDPGQYLIREFMKISIRHAIVEDNKQVWRNFNRVFGPFIITTTRGRGRPKNAELRKWVRTEVARRGRGGIQSLADELGKDRRWVEKYLYDRKKLT